MGKDANNQFDFTGANKTTFKVAGANKVSLESEDSFRPMQAII